MITINGAPIAGWVTINGVPAAQQLPWAAIGGGSIGDAHANADQAVFGNLSTDMQGFTLFTADNGYIHFSDSANDRDIQLRGECSTKRFFIGFDNAWYYNFYAGQFTPYVGRTITLGVAGSPWSDFYTNGDVYHTGSKLGFYSATPAVQPAAYTTSNVTPDRTLDADSTDTAELADVLCTLIEDLKTLGLLGSP
jgi:hypothetical protein